MPDTPNKLSFASVSLHWLVGIAMILLLAVGIYMENTETYALYPIHKSFGVLILLLVLPRIFVRIKNGWPTPLAGRQAAEIMLSRVVQWVLILSTVLMPVSGMMMSGFGGHGVSVFGLELVAGNYDPVLEKVVPINGDLAGMAHSAHGILGNVLIVALLLHIAGALKSRFIAKDGTVLRMLGKEV